MTNVYSFPCRNCGTMLDHGVVDLGMSPLCEAFLPVERLDTMEPFYPLNVFVCHECYLVQINEYVTADSIFEEYAYFSSYSTAWLDHCKNYVDTMTERLSLDEQSFVVELASNDGYLLQYFVEKGIPCRGIEPSKNVSQAAIDKGVPTDVEFFTEHKGKAMAAEGAMADLVLGKNVLAQVPDLGDFVAGIPHLLKPTGTVTIEFPHIKQLIEENQFDTIYHEHFCYFGLTSVEDVFARRGLTVFDVDELWTHGGSLRIHARHTADQSRPVTDAVHELRAREEAAGYRDVAMYAGFEQQVRETKRGILDLLIRLKRAGKSIVGYGAPGKGNTLLNYCGIRTDLIDFTVDRNPYKHGRYLPGTRIPIFEPEKLDEVKPDYIFILPWNLKDEIMNQLAHTREWGAQFIVPIPEATVI